MPVLENQKHERFAQLLAEGKSATTAYRKVYKGTVKAAGASGARLSKNVRIKERIRELQGKSAEKAVLTLARKRELLNEMAEGMTPSKVTMSADGPVEVFDRARAIELDGKFSGELTEQHKVEVSGQLSVLEVAERVKLASPLLAARLAKEDKN